MITKKMLIEFRSDFKNAVKDLEKKYGGEIKIGNIVFATNDFHTKLNFELLDKSGVSIPKAEEFSMYAPIVGVPSNWLNKTFSDRTGKTFRISGINPRKQKNSIELTCDANGKRYGCSPEYVKMYLKE